MAIMRYSRSVPSPRPNRLEIFAEPHHLKPIIMTRQPRPTHSAADVTGVTARSRILDQVASAGSHQTVRRRRFSMRKRLLAVAVLSAMTAFRASAAPVAPNLHVPPTQSPVTQVHWHGYHHGGYGGWHHHWWWWHS
jgi:hypothetical protein